MPWKGEDLFPYNKRRTLIVEFVDKGRSGAEKNALDQIIVLKSCRLEKGIEGSEARLYQET